MEDIELLKAAAKAADIPVQDWYECGASIFPVHGWPGKSWWNSLTDDGDTQRLAVCLGLLFDLETSRLYSEELAAGKTPDVAARRAFTRAAAAKAGDERTDK